MKRIMKFCPGLLIIALLLLTPFASSFPDGLEKVAHDLGFISAEKHIGKALMPEYTVPMLGDNGVSTIIAGLVGAGVLLLIFWLINKIMQLHNQSH